MTADIDRGLNTWRRDERLRLWGIDTPEIRTKDDAEKAAGYRARDALRERVLDKDIIICTIDDEQGKFGRYLTILWAGDENLNEWLLREGYADPYE